MKTHNSVWLATGPGAWIKALGQEETTTMAIIEFDDLFEKHHADQLQFDADEKERIRGLAKKRSASIPRETVTKTQ